jgi:hypothetical protein
MVELCSLHASPWHAICSKHHPARQAFDHARSSLDCTWAITETKPTLMCCSMFTCDTGGDLNKVTHFYHYKVQLTQPFILAGCSCHSIRRGVAAAQNYYSTL